MANYTELIDKYLNNELSPEEKKAFEEQLQTNTELKAEYDLQLDVVKGVQRMGIKTQVQRSFRKAKMGKTMMRIAVVSLTAIVVLSAAYFAKKKLEKPANNIKYELNEGGTNNWAEADKVLEGQLFNIDPTKDTVIETKGGIVIAIPANAFLNKFGEAEKNRVDVEIKEALTAFDIMKAGLSTTSNGQLLETGGMFYVNARIGKNNLDIDLEKPLQASVPYEGKRNDMMLFDGQREKDGSINWVNPIPTEKQLVTTDILKLNFYPPHYLDSLKAWGYDDSNKKFTDSLYYSFICGSSADVPAVNNVPVITDSTPREIVEMWRVMDSLEKSYDAQAKKYNARFANSSADGKTLFKQNCAVCHSMGTIKLTGPGLAGVRNRVPKGDWLFDYIKNNEKMIKAGDPYANKIWNENGKAAMTVFEGTLSDADIKAITDYVAQGEGGIAIPTMSTCERQGIEPEYIRSIWDPKFNNTILATKEFEERLKVIFTTCNNSILGMYMQNLDKSLWELDSVAATLCSEPQKQQFIDFYNRRDGGLKIQKQHMNKLHEYMSERQTTYRAAATLATQKMMEEEAKKENIANEKLVEHMNAQAEHDSKNFNEEYKLNLKEAYRQLDKPYRENPPAQNFVSGPIVTTGWKNVDAYVMESVANRTTLDYTDPESGKKAVIRYEPLTVTVGNSKSYDKIVCYLIPDKLSSFQLMKNNGTNFTENLNELIEYNLLVIGFKGDKYFYADQHDVKPQSYSFNLNEIREQDLNGLTRSYSDLKGKQIDLAKELRYQVFEQKENIRQVKKKEMEDFRMKVMSVIFPCYVKPAVVSEARPVTPAH